MLVYISPQKPTFSLIGCKKTINTSFTQNKLPPHTKPRKQEQNWDRIKSTTHTHTHTQRKKLTLDAKTTWGNPFIDTKKKRRKKLRTRRERQQEGTEIPKRLCAHVESFYAHGVKVSTSSRLFRRLDDARLTSPRSMTVSTASSDDCCHQLTSHRRERRSAVRYYGLLHR